MSWVRKKKIALLILLFILHTEAVPTTPPMNCPASGLVCPVGLWKMHTVLRQQHHTLSKHSLKLDVIFYLHADPIPLFYTQFQRGKCFFFHLPTAQGRGIFTCGRRTGARATTPAWQHLRLPCGVKWCRRHCVKGEGFFFFFLLNESNLINITIRSLVWKQCGTKFSNCSLCHITLGTFVHSAHLALPAFNFTLNTLCPCWHSAPVEHRLDWDAKNNKIHKMANIWMCIWKTCL